MAPIFTMKKTHQPPKTIDSGPKLITPGQNPINKRIGGYDEISSFLHKVSKLIIEERAKYASYENTQLT